MFERFTDRARRVVVLAQEEARLLNHNYIGTEHILLGLAAEREGTAARVLSTLDIEPDALRAEIEQLLGRGDAMPSGHLPFTPRAKKVLELSLREALQLGHNYIGTEHILLGLIREEDGVGAQALVRKGADLVRVRRLVTATPARSGPEPIVPTSPPEVALHSLREENRWLRHELDRLREFLRAQGLWEIIPQPPAERPPGAGPAEAP